MDHLAFPHILDAIIGFSSYDGLIALRGTSRCMRDRIDPLLAQRLQVRMPPSTKHDLNGPLTVTFGAAIPLSRCPAVEEEPVDHCAKHRERSSDSGGGEQGNVAEEDADPESPLGPAISPEGSSPAAQSSTELTSFADVLNTDLALYTNTLALARVVDIFAPTTHYRLWHLYPHLTAVDTIRYRGPDLYETRFAETSISVGHMTDPFLISLGATCVVASLDSDTPAQIRRLAFPILRHGTKAVINMWWSPARASRSAAHRCNLIDDAGVKDLVFICRSKEDGDEGADKASGSSPASDGAAPSKVAETEGGPDAAQDTRLDPFKRDPAQKTAIHNPRTQKMGMFRNILKFGLGRILSPDWTKVLTFVGLETVAPAALGYHDVAPASEDALHDDVLGFILSDGLGGEPPDDYAAAMALLQERVRFLTHAEYAAEVGAQDYDIELLPAHD